jgi:hypothetical protein
MDLFNVDIPPGLASALTGIEKQFLMLRSSGSSIRDIAKTLKKSTHTISNWNKKFAKDLLNLRNSEFCELQKKVIESKTERLNLLKSEFNRASNLLKKHKMDVNETYGGYNKYLELFVKLSDLMSSCESDILTVGVRFKDNIDSEISLTELEKDENQNPIDTVALESNSVVEDEISKIIDNKELKGGKQQTATKCNTATPRKYELYKKTHIYKNKNKEAFP